MAEAVNVTDPDNQDVATAEDARRERIAEWGVWVATAPIDIDGVRAFNPGEAVPVGHVARFDLERHGVVAKRDTKAAKAANPSS